MTSSERLARVKEVKKPGFDLGILMLESEIQIDCRPKCWTVLLSEVRLEEFWTS